MGPPNIHLAMCICWKLSMDSQVMPETALSIGFTIHNLQMRPRECAVLSKVKQAEHGDSCL